MFSIIPIILPIYESGKSAIRGIISAIIQVITTFNSALDLVQVISDSIVSILSIIGDLSLTIPPLKIPDGLSGIPIVGDLFKAAISALNVFTNFLNTILGVFNPIFNVFKQLVGIIQKIANTANTLIKGLISINNSLINFFTYYNNNPGVVLYNSAVFIFSIYAIIPSTQIIIAAMPVLWTVSGLLLVYSPIIFYWYFRLFQGVKVSGSGIDMAVINTENTLLFTERGAQIFYPFLYVLILGAIYGLILSDILSKYIFSYLPSFVLMTLTILPLIPVLIYLYSFIFLDPLKLLIQQLATALNVSANDSRFNSITALQSVKNLTGSTATDLVNGLTQAFNLDDTGQAALNSLGIIYSNSSQSQLQFLSNDKTQIDSLKSEISSVLRITPTDSRWGAVNQALESQIKQIISQTMQNIANTFTLTQSQNQTLLALNINNLNFLSNSIDQSSFKISVQSALGISSSDSRWNAALQSSASQGTGSSANSVGVAAVNLMDLLLSQLNPPQTLPTQAATDLGNIKTASDFTTWSNTYWGIWNILTQENQILVMSSLPSSTGPAQQLDSTAYLKSQEPQVASAIKAAIISSFTLNQNDKDIINNLSVNGFNFLTDSNAFVKFQNTVQNSLLISTSDKRWAQVTLFTDTNALASATSSQLKSQIITAFSMNQDQQNQLVGIAVLNIGAQTLGMVTIKNILALNYVTQTISDYRNQIIICYAIAARAFYELISVPTIQQLLEGVPGNVYLILQILPFIPLIAWLYLIFINKEDYREAVDNIKSVILFQNAKFSVFYPLIYIFGLGMYYGILSTNIPSILLGQLPEFVNFCLYSIPLVPLVDYFYRLLTLNSINLGSAGLIEIFQTNAQAAVNQTIADFTNFNILFIVTYAYAVMAFYRLYSNFSTYIEIFPQPVPTFIQVIPLIPLGIYLYLLFWLKRSNDDAINLTIQTILFRNMQVSIAYPIFYIILASIYYGVLNQVGTVLVDYIPATLSLALILLPIIPALLYLYRITNDPMYLLKTDISNALGIDISNLSKINSLNSINSINGKTSASIILEIQTDLNLTQNQVTQLKNIPEFQIDQINNLTFRNAITINGVFSDLMNRDNQIVFLYLFAIRGYFEILSLSTVEGMLGLIPGVLSTAITPFIQILPFIPLLVFIYTCFDDKKITQLQISKTVRLFTDIFMNWKDNSDIITYCFITMFAIFLSFAGSLFQVSEDTNLFIQRLLVFALLLLLVPLMMFGFYFSRSRNLQISISSTRMSIQALNQPNVLYYLGFVFTSYSIYSSPTIKSLLDNAPTWLTLLFQLGLILSLVPLLLFIYSLFTQGNIQIALNAYSTFLNLRLPSISTIAITGGSNSPTIDLNPNLTQLERFFFGMLFADQPQSSYYNLNPSLITQISINSPNNFTRLYTLQELNTEFFGSANYNSGKYDSGDMVPDTMSRIDYIMLPLKFWDSTFNITNQLTQLIQNLLGQNGVPLHQIQEELIIQYAYGYDSNNNLKVVTGGATISQGTPQIQQGVLNRQFISQAINKISSSSINSSDIYNEVMNRIDAYIKIFTPFLGTANMRAASDLKSYIYTTGENFKVALVSSQINIKSALSLSYLTLNTQLFDRCYNNLISNFGDNTNTNTNLNLIYSMIIGEFPLESFSRILINIKALAINSLFNNTGTQNFTQLLNSQGANNIQDVMFNSIKQLVNNFANINTRSQMNILTTAAAGSGLSSVQISQLDGCFFSNFYKASVLLNEIYNSLSSITMQFAPSLKTTDSLDMAAFRNSVSKFKWPANQNNSNINRFIDNSQLKNNIINALNLNTINIQALNNLPSLSGTTFDILKADLVNQLKLEVITMLNLNQPAGIKVDIAQALQLQNSDTLKLNSLPLLNSGPINLVDLTVFSQLQYQIVNALGLNDRQSIINQLASYLNLTSNDLSNLGNLPSLTPTNLNILDPALTISVQNDVIKFISSTDRIKNNIITSLELDQNSQNALNSIASLNTPNIDLNDQTIKQNIQSDIQTALQLNSSAIMKARISSALNLNSNQSAQLNQLPLLSSPSLNLTIPGTIEKIKQQISNLFNASGIINCNDIKNYIINTLSLNNIEIAKINTVALLNNMTIDLSVRANLNSLTSQILQQTQWNSSSWIKSNISTIFKPSSAQQVILNSILNTPTIDLTNVQNMAAIKLAIINALSLDSSSVPNLQKIPTFNPSISTILSLSEFTSQCVNTSLLNNVLGLQNQAYNALSLNEIQNQNAIIAQITNIPGLNPVIIKALSLQNSPAIQCINKLNNIPELSQAMDLASQNTKQLEYWYNNFRNYPSNWLSLYNTDLVLDQVSGKPKEIGWQIGCPKGSREDIHSQLTNIFSCLESQIGTFDSDNNKILSKICQIIDLVALPNQFIYEISLKGQNDKDYQALSQQIDQYFSGFIDIQNGTMSLLSLLSPNYEYSHFMINLPLNMGPIKIANLDTNLDENNLQSLINQNTYEDNNYIDARNKFAKACIMKWVLDMTWWHQFVLWYYPLPEVLGKNYQSSGPVIQYNYSDSNQNLIKSTGWRGKTEAVNRFKYTAIPPTTLTMFDGSNKYNSTNATINSTITLKQNPAIWIGNGCMGYGMQYLFASWANNFYNTTYQMITDYPCLSSVLFDNNTSLESSVFYQMAHAYRHDAMVGYIFVSASPMTMNRFYSGYSWQDARKLAFTSDPPGGSNIFSRNFVNPDTKNPNNLYQILFTENRRSVQLNSGDEYICGMSGSIPSIYFNNNTKGPVNAPNSPLFYRGCIDNLDFGNSLFYGVSSLSSITQNGFGNLGYSPTQGNLAQTNWNFSGNSGDLTTIQNNILNVEGKYYLNSLDWLINRSSIGSGLAKDNNINHLLAPLNPGDLWNNSYKFLTNPLSFFDLNKSYQLYPLTLLPKITQNFVNAENSKPVQINIPDVPEFHNVAWVVQKDNGQDNGTVPSASIISNTKWTSRFNS